MKKINLIGVGAHVQVAHDTDREIKALNEDWETRERHPGGFTLIMGMSDGKGYAYGIQEDYEAICNLCEEERRAEKANPSAFKWLGVRKWHLPAVIKFELEARGLPVDDIIESGDTAELDYIIETEFPELKLTNLSLLRSLKKAKAIDTLT